MANETTKVPVTAVLGDEVSFSTGGDGANVSEGLSVDVKRPDPKPAGDKPKVEGEKPAGEEVVEKPAEEGDKPEGEEKPAAEKLEDLGEWKPEDPETLAKFDGRYLDDKGKLNTSLITQEWDANKGADGKGKLNPGTEAYIMDTFALSKEGLDDIAEGLEARRAEKARNNFNERYRIAGGGPNYERLVAWGRANYTDAQKTEFNAAMESGGEKMSAALERLIGQYVVKNPNQPLARPGAGPARRRTSTPERAVGGEGTGTGGAKPRWETQEEYKAEFTAAEKAFQQADRRGTGKERREALAKLEALRAAGRNTKFKS